MTNLPIASHSCSRCDHPVAGPAVERRPSREAAGADRSSRQTLPRAAAPAGATLPPGYVIGPDDVLSIVFWRDKDMSADVVVRPDGKISLPLLNDVQAAGLTPDQLRARAREGGGEVHRGAQRDGGREGDQQPQGLHHRQVVKPGTYPLNGDMTVLQLIALAGGLQEYADSKNIVVMRKEDGQGSSASSSTTRTWSSRRTCSRTSC